MNALCEDMSAGVINREIPRESIVFSMAQHPDLRRVIDFIKEHPNFIPTCQARDGLLSRPMTVLEIEDDGELWMFRAVGSAPV